MASNDPEHTLEFLLAFDGFVHTLEQGYWLKFEIRRVKETKERPHGLRYAFTLHDPSGRRLLGYDNAHRVRTRGSARGGRTIEADHWHRSGDDEGTPYAFKSTDALLADFFREVRRVLKERGLSDRVVKTKQTKRGQDDPTQDY